MFLESGVGICTKRDRVAYHNSKDELLTVLKDFNNLEISKIKDKHEIERIESRDKKTQYAKNNIIEYGIKEEYLQKINYRPFDKKWTYYTKKVVAF